MTSAPLIGIPCRHDTSGRYVGRPVNTQNIAYVRAVIQAGGVPFLIPLELEGQALRSVYDLADGILLAGGGDIDPARYQETAQTNLVDVQDERDQMEIALVQWAADDGKPLLGICRGIQVITVAGGGRLIQDIATQLKDADRHDFFYTNGGHPRDFLAHEVTLDPNSRLARILQTSTLMVNSLHHQAIRTIPEPYQIIGCAKDSIPEVVDLPGHPFFLGVQWHPEELAPTQITAQKLFEAFIEASMGQKPVT